MSKKVLTGAMAAVMAAGMVPTVAGAATNVDALYKAAYQATAKALQTKTQADVNTARTAVRALPKTMDWAIGEFSKQLDTVQHPILVNIVTAIDKATAEPTQANIDAARKTIPAELPTQWKNSYSAAVDKVQQGLQTKVVEAVKKAETEKTQAAVEAARKLVADVATAESAALKEWAKAMNAKLDAVKVGLTIKTADITTTTVKLTFEKVTEALRDVKLNVVNNKGEVVAVKAKSIIIEGEQEATFYLEKELTARPEGVWTVNGVTVNLDAKNLVADVKTATDREKLFDVLKKSSLVENLVDEVANQKEYFRLVGERKADKIVTVADVQKVIDDANKNVGSNSLVTDVVKAAKTGTVSAYKEAFAKLSLERVNADWIMSYRDGKTVGTTTYVGIKSLAETAVLSDVQAIIDAINEAEALAAYADVMDDAKLDSAKIDKAIAYIDQYVVVAADNTTAQKAKAAKIHDLNVKLAIVKVNEADTQTSLKSSLTNLQTVVNDKAVFEYAKVVNESLMLSYVKEKIENVSYKDGFATVDGIKALLTSVETAETAKAVTAVKTAAKAVVDAAADKKVDKKADLINSLKALSDVTAKATVKFDNSKVKPELFDKYAPTLATATTVAEMNTVIATVNNVNVSGIIGTPTTADALYTALKDVQLGLGSRLVEANKAVYWTEYTANPAYFTTNLDTLTKTMEIINSKEVIIASSSIATVKSELTDIAVKTNLVEFINLRDAQKSDVAELLIANLKTDSFKDDKSVAGLYDALTFSYNQRAELMAGINGTSATILSVKSSLEVISAEFKALGNSEKLTLAEKVLVNRPKVDNKLVDLNSFTEVRELMAKVK